MQISDLTKEIIWLYHKEAEWANNKIARKLKLSITLVRKVIQQAIKEDKLKWRGFEQAVDSEGLLPKGEPSKM